MAVSFVSSSSTTAATRTNTTITAPTGIANDDILIIISLIEDDRTPTPPSGFTQILNIDHASHPMDLWIWWKKASSESGNYTITHASNFCQSVMLCYRGADGENPIIPSPTSNTGMTNSTMTASSITTTIDGSMVIYAAGTWDDTPGSTPPTGSTPTFTERFDPAGTNILYVADGVMTTIGTTGDKTVTGPATNGWMTSLIAIRASRPNLVQSFSNTASSTTVAATATTTSGNLLVAAITSTQTISGISDNFGNTWTEIGSNITANTSNMRCFYAQNIVGGASHSVTATIAFSNDVAVVVREYSGTARTGAFDVTASSTGFSTSPSSTATSSTAQATELVVGFCVAASTSASFALGTGFNSLHTRVNGSTSTLAAEDRTVTTAGAQTATYTSAMAFWACRVATFRESRETGAFFKFF